MLRKRILISLAVALLVAGAAAAAAVLAWRELNAPLSIAAEGTWLQVSSGMSLRRVTVDLAEQGTLDRPWLLAAYGRATGEATRIHAGEYRLLPGTTPISLLATLVAGDVHLHQVTIVEGSRFTELLSGLRAHPAIDASTLDSEAIMAALGAPGVHPEGQFFPDTYRFPRGTRDLDVLQLAHRALANRLDTVWRNRSPDVLLKNEYEALILASIIEKETALATERRQIAGVFHERLRRNMRLQTDPTVIYGLGDAFDGNLRRQDLERDTPYNTYTRAGLPPTPISLPGAGSLEAAVTPEMSGAIYFVATGRSDGSHYFSTNLEEHERAVREYLRQLRSREP
jgi:UPF0755 protein